MSNLNTFRVDVATSMTVPAGMASIRHIGTRSAAAYSAFNYFSVGRDAWGKDSPDHGVLLSKWDESLQEYVILDSRWPDQHVD